MPKRLMGDLGRVAGLVLLGLLVFGCSSGRDPAQTVEATSASDAVEPATSTPVPGRGSTSAVGVETAILARCDAPPAEFVEIPRTSVMLPALDGFEVATNVSGLVSDSTGGSVVVVEFPAGLDEVLGGSLDTFARQAPGIVWLNEEEARFADRSGYLVLAEQTAAGIRFVKWLALVDGGEQTLMLTAQAPLVSPTALVRELRSAVLCARWTPGTIYESPAGEPFGITPSRLFTEAQASAGGLSYSAGDAAFFIVVPSLGPVARGSEEAVALSAFASLGPGPIDDTPTVVADPTAITISGLDGLALEGSGTNEGVAIWLYQVILFRPDGYYFRMIGSSPIAEREVLEPEIKAMADSFWFRE